MKKANKSIVIDYSLINYFFARNIMVCPIIETCSALKTGGYVADDDEDTKGLVEIDNELYYFNDAPTIIGFNAFDQTRRAMKEKTGGAEDINSSISGNINSIVSDNSLVHELRVIDKLHDLEVRESMKNVFTGGYADVPSRDDIINRHAGNGTLIEKEQRLIDRLRELAKK